MREETGQMQRFLHQVKKRTETLKRLALLGLAEGGKTLPEEKSETRYSTREEVEVLLIRSLRHEPDQKRTSLVFLDNTSINIPIFARSLNCRDLRSLSLRLMENTVRVPIHMAPVSVGRKGVQWLGDYLYLGNSEESQLRIGLVGEDSQVRSMNMGEANERYVISYSAHIGYQAKSRRG
jgi:CRISPR-associated endonuclease/helicase Cas3